MKHIKWPIIIASLVCGAFFGLVVGLLSENALHGLIAMGIATSIVLLTLCLVSMSN